MGCLEPQRASAGVEGKGRLWWPHSSGTVGAHSMSGAQIPAPGIAGLWSTWRLSRHEWMQKGQQPSLRGMPVCSVGTESKV